MGRRQTAIERFEAKFIPEPNSGCWLWIASSWKDGYGNFRLFGRIMGAHRAAWILYKDALPDEVKVLHRCDVPACVNPDHLFLGTDGDNAADRSVKGRSARMRGSENQASVLSEHQVREIAENHTLNACDMAAAYGVSPSAVAAIKKGKTWKHLGLRPLPTSSARPSICGQGNHKAKISEDQARKIKADLRKTRFVAAEYGVSKSIVGNIRSGKTWKHI